MLVHIEHITPGPLCLYKKCHSSSIHFVLFASAIIEIQPQDTTIILVSIQKIQFNCMMHYNTLQSRAELIWTRSHCVAFQLVRCGA